jgi:hypothetical protein
MSDQLKGLKERNSKLSDMELLKLVNFEFADYREEAIDLAKEELERRGFRLIQTGANFQIIDPRGMELTPPQETSTFSETSLSSDQARGSSNPSKPPISAYLLTTIGGIASAVLVLSAWRFYPHVVDVGLLSFVLPLPLMFALSGILGYKFPKIGWKLGLSVSVVFELAVLLMSIIVGIPVQGLLSHLVVGLMAVSTACLGAQAGTYVARQTNSQ